MSKPFLSIIIPAHNEAQRLPIALEQVRQFLARQDYQSEVIVVENASTDKTLEIARSWEGRLPGLRVLTLEQPGKGGAVRVGMLAAEGEYRFMADADFSMPAAEISRFLPPELMNTAVAIGSRETPGSKRIGEPLYRHLVGRVFNTMVRWLVLPGLQDSQCGFKCFREDAAEAAFSRQTLTGWSFDVEVLAIARELGFGIREVPVTWAFDRGSRVQVLKDSVRMARDLWIIRGNVRRGLYSAPKV